MKVYFLKDELFVLKVNNLNDLSVFLVEFVNLEEFVVVVVYDIFLNELSFLVFCGCCFMVNLDLKNFEN